ncbi:MAG: Gfo/Idh/MocA family oxidoreductase [Planctomycetaceae bacterium]|jgi:predicted dehydrogenase|nr:Gfo/Idh/MocA family oxidoreductase [Planctomycetaceae bacterium]
MKKPNRRKFLQAATITSAGYLVAEGNAQDQPAAESSGEKPNVACIGIGGKGGSDSDNAAKFGNVVAICDVDRSRLEGKSKKEGFQKAQKYTDFRELLDKHGKNLQIVTVSGPDHMHAAATLMAMRAGCSVYTQKPLTRTIYEARKLAEVAKETGVCTQMGNQGTALDTSRTAIAQLNAGVVGTVTEVIVWSNRPVWSQKPDRRENLTSFAEKGYKAAPDRKTADKMIWAKFAEVKQGLDNLDWKNWISTAKYRDYYPGLYHSFQWRGWWDFGSGALGDMACHMMTVPFAAAGLKDPTWVRAKSTGHDFDSFPASSVIEFEFPANDDPLYPKRGKIPFWWYDRRGNKPPKEKYEEYGIQNLADAGVLVIGDKGAFYSADDYCGKYQLLAKGGEEIKPLPNITTELAENKGNFDVSNMYELFRAVKAKDPKICKSNFVDRAGPLTETILLGNLAVWAASQGGANGAMGDWGEKIEWDAKNLQVTNLSSLKTPGVQELVKPVYSDGYRLD